MKQAVPTYKNREADKMNTVNDKVVVILGASNGIGEATGRLLADKGAKLVIASRSEENSGNRQILLKDALLLIRRRMWPAMKK